MRRKNKARKGKGSAMNDDILSKRPGRPHEKGTVMKGQAGRAGSPTQKQQKRKGSKPGVAVGWHREEWPSGRQRESRTQIREE